MKEQQALNDNFFSKDIGGGREKLLITNSGSTKEKIHPMSGCASG